MMRSFTQAAASYFGLTPQVTEIGTSQDGQMLAVFTVALTDEDIAAIVARMQNIAQVEQEVPVFTPDSQVDTAALRATYDAMTPQEKGKYGSFARFLSVRRLEDFTGRVVAGTPIEPSPNWGTGGRTVTHVDGPEPEGDGAMPEAVWVKPEDMELSQGGLWSEFCTKRRAYLMQVAMLTQEQREKYGVKP